MSGKSLIVGMALSVFLFSGGFVRAACPSADLNGDCFVDFKDFAVLTDQWLYIVP